MPSSGRHRTAPLTTRRRDARPIVAQSGPPANPRGYVHRGLGQRLAIRAVALKGQSVAPMDLAESAQYLRHHLALVGRTDPLLADDAVARLHKWASDCRGRSVMPPSPR